MRLVLLILPIKHYTLLHLSLFMDVLFVTLTTCNNQLTESPARTIHDAVRLGDVKTLAIMVKNGVDINDVDKKHKFTPLHWASHAGSLEVAYINKILIFEDLLKNAIIVLKPLPFALILSACTGFCGMALIPHAEHLKDGLQRTYQPLGGRMRVCR